mmetsp:Transcript_33361/g.78962  ORF Transcript_33361/g.78962 Transcript_33361/m.78962 type:complete len:227 (-) Transcript_33361:46-726(-)
MHHAARGADSPGVDRHDSLVVDRLVAAGHGEGPLGARHELRGVELEGLGFVRHGVGDAHEGDDGEGDDARRHVELDEVDVRHHVPGGVGVVDQPRHAAAALEAELPRLAVVVRGVVRLCEDLLPHEPVLRLRVGRDLDGLQELRGAVAEHELGSLLAVDLHHLLAARPDRCREVAARVAPPPCALNRNLDRVTGHVIRLPPEDGRIAEVPAGSCHHIPLCAARGEP